MNTSMIKRLKEPPQLLATQWLWQCNSGQMGLSAAYLQLSYYKQDNSLLKRAVKNGGLTERFAMLSRVLDAAQNCPLGGADE